MYSDLVGWLAAAILLATLANQVYRQWRDRSVRGVSPWLFVGQVAASIGFVAYSWMKSDWVFLVTNGLILLTAIAGEAIFMRNRRGAGRKPS
jgi:uncharacterized protein with PQ loop repeat